MANPKDHPMNGIIRRGDHVRFPAVTFRGPEDFQRYAGEHKALLEERLRQELLLVKKRGPTMAGTCGVCLAVTQFTSEGAPSAVGYARDQQLCGCESKLASYKRALLHFAAPNFGGGWFRLGLYGWDDALAQRLSTVLPPAWIWPNEQAASGSTHMVLSADALGSAPSLEEALAHIARALLPGGLFIFTLPFDPHAMATVPAPDNRLQRFGWDILERVRDAGFLDCTAHFYWSAELGLLGSNGMIFKAFR